MLRDCHYKIMAQCGVAGMAPGWYTYASGLVGWNEYLLGCTDTPPGIPGAVTLSVCPRVPTRAHRVPTGAHCVPTGAHGVLLKWCQIK